MLDIIPKVGHWCVVLPDFVVEFLRCLNSELNLDTHG